MTFKSYSILSTFGKEGEVPNLILDVKLMLNNEILCILSRDFGVLWMVTSPKQYEISTKFLN